MCYTWRIEKEAEWFSLFIKSLTIQLELVWLKSFKTFLFVLLKYCRLQKIPKLLDMLKGRREMAKLR